MFYRPGQRICGDFLPPPQSCPQSTSAGRPGGWANSFGGRAALGGRRQGRLVAMEPSRLALAAWDLWRSLPEVSQVPWFRRWPEPRGTAEGGWSEWSACGLGRVALVTTSLASPVAQALARTAGHDKWQDLRSCGDKSLLDVSAGTCRHKSGRPAGANPRVYGQKPRSGTCGLVVTSPGVYL